MKGNAMLMELAAGTVENGAKALDGADLAGRLALLDGWALVDEGKVIERRFEVKGFARAQAIAILAGGIAETAGHHPDILFGWGYCTIRFSTHSAGGITMNDLICAARLNLLT